jgi:hypothetical protein
LSLDLDHPFFPDAAAEPAAIGGPEGLPPGHLAAAVERPSIHTFAIYVDDDRYNVPTLYLLAASDEDCARRAAESILDDWRHRGVELWRGDVRLLALGSYASAPGR